MYAPTRTDDSNLLSIHCFLLHPGQALPPEEHVCQERAHASGIPISYPGSLQSTTGEINQREAVTDATEFEHNGEAYMYMIVIVYKIVSSNHVWIINTSCLEDCFEFVHGTDRMHNVQLSICIASIGRK